MAALMASKSSFPDGRFGKYTVLAHLATGGMGKVYRAVDGEEFRVTRAGSTVGTIDYLAPEQARDSATADVRSDIYSLGCTFYQMLAGHPPFPEGGLKLGHQSGTVVAEHVR